MLFCSTSVSYDSHIAYLFSLSLLVVPVDTLKSEQVLDRKRTVIVPNAWLVSLFSSPKLL